MKQITCCCGAKLGKYDDKGFLIFEAPYECEQCGYNYKDDLFTIMEAAAEEMSE
jgi:predicted Zn-ribbon and HTH transcriptional regulator